MEKISLKNRIFEILSDGKPHRSDEITSRLFGTADTVCIGLFRLAPRIRDLKNDGHKIEGWHDENNPKLYWYQLRGIFNCSGQGEEIIAVEVKTPMREFVPLSVANTAVKEQMQLFHIPKYL